MTYKINQYDTGSGDETCMVSYSDVNISDWDTFTGDIESASGTSTAYSLYDPYGQALTADVRTSVNPFTDVSDTDWFYEESCTSIQNPLMNGTDDGVFSPA
jgi:hypothetical protein